MIAQIVELRSHRGVLFRFGSFRHSRTRGILSEMISEAASLGRSATILESEHRVISLIVRLIFSHAFGERGGASPPVVRLFLPLPMNGGANAAPLAGPNVNLTINKCQTE